MLGIRVKSCHSVHGTPMPYGRFRSLSNRGPDRFCRKLGMVLGLGDVFGNEMLAIRLSASVGFQLLCPTRRILCGSGRLIRDLRNFYCQPCGPTKTNRLIGPIAPEDELIVLEFC